MPSVLFATNGSEDARAAAKRALELATDRELDLHVLCVVDSRKLSEPAVSSDELATIYAEERGHDCVEEVSEMAAGTGLSVDGDVRHGVPHETILEYADEVDATVIVVGEHGRHEDHFGGVGREVRERAGCEVVVVGRDTEP
jgi:nucleotide-binding universal stress UspA family protein